MKKGTHRRRARNVENMPLFRLDMVSDTPTPVYHCSLSTTPAQFLMHRDMLIGADVTFPARRRK